MATRVRWRWDVLRADSIPEVLRRAFLLARVPPGGPTFVTVSKDLWETTVERAEILLRDRSELQIDVRPDPDQVTRTVDMLLAAQHPVITAGRELDRYGGVDEVREIAELLGAPVFTDVSAAHCPLVFPTSHPLYGGMYLEDPAFTRDLDLYWSVGATMFTVARASTEPWCRGQRERSRRASMRLKWGATILSMWQCWPTCGVQLAPFSLSSAAETCRSA